MDFLEHKALIIGEYFAMIFGAINVFKKAKFTIDVITTNSSLKKIHDIQNYQYCKSLQDMLSCALTKNLDEYDIIIIGDDLTLKTILDSDISEEIKLKLLPVKNTNNFNHIASKIKLSEILHKNNIPTPKFAVANNVDEAASHAETIGFPVMVKVDFSCGGSGVFECKNQKEIHEINPYYFKLPLLIQKKIIGKELDLSAFYLDGKLIHFHYCQVEKVIGGKFGISSLRKYFQPSEISKKIFQDLTNIGQALGANGFVTISYLQENSEIGYFIEADMRPNVWIDFTHFIGDDISIKIVNWFKNKEALKYPIALNENYPKSLIIPYWLRLNWFEILTNRHNVWKFIPKIYFRAQIDYIYQKRRDLIINILEKTLEKIRKNRDLIYMYLSKLPRRIKRLPTILIRLILPNKEDRIKIKTYIRSKLITRQQNTTAP